MHELTYTNSRFGPKVLMMLKSINEPVKPNEILSKYTGQDSDLTDQQISLGIKLSKEKGFVVVNEDKTISLTHKGELLSSGF